MSLEHLLALSLIKLTQLILVAYYVVL